MDRAGLKPTRLLLTLLALAAAYGGAAGADEAAEVAAGPPAPTESPDQPAEYQCDKPGSDGQAMLDKMQRGVYFSVCGSARWFDGMFGTRRYDQDSDATYGRMRLIEEYDRRDGLSTALRMRARIALPAMKDRLRLVFGRVDDREVVEDASEGNGPALPSSFQKVEDDTWLLGLGYGKESGLENGFDFGAGIRIRTPVEPYAKGTYRHNFVFDDATALRARETTYWRDGTGFGTLTELDLDHLLTPTVLLRWNNTANLDEDARRLEWGSALITFQSLSERRGVAYTAFISGVVNTDVPVRDYGVEIRYRQRILRRWLFLQVQTSLTWPRESLDEEREINPGVGLGFEMYFGPVPDSKLR